MVRLEQQQAQINVMITALQSSLERMTSVESNDDIKRAIFLHCAMILFYQKLQKLLDTSKFKDFFNKNLSHLLDENSNTLLFQELENTYNFELPGNLMPPELVFMVKFSAVILSECSKSLGALNNSDEDVSLLIPAAGLLAKCFILLVIYAALLLTPTIMSLPFALPLSFIAVVLFATYFFKKSADELDLIRQLHSVAKMWTEFACVPGEDLSNLISSNIATIYPNGELEIPCIQNLLPEIITEKNMYRRIQPLFFALPDELIITQDDLATKPSAGGVTMAHASN